MDVRISTDGPSAKCGARFGVKQNSSEMGVQRIGSMVLEFWLSNICNSKFVCKYQNGFVRCRRRSSLGSYPLKVLCKSSEIEMQTRKRNTTMTDAHTIPGRPNLDARGQARAESLAPRSARIAASATVPSAVIAPASPTAFAPPSWNLTPQQWRVFLLVGRALSNKAIAHELKVAESTVKAHISAIFKVSGCRNRTEAALLSLRVRYGLLEPEADNASTHNAALIELRRSSKIGRDR